MPSPNSFGALTSLLGFDSALANPSFGPNALPNSPLTQAAGGPAPNNAAGFAPNFAGGAKALGTLANFIQSQQKPQPQFLIPRFLNRPKAPPIPTGRRRF